MGERIRPAARLMYVAALVLLCTLIFGRLPRQQRHPGPDLPSCHTDRAATHW